MKINITSQQQAAKRKRSKKRMNIWERLMAPTPSFFRKIRRVGLILTALSGSVLAAPLVFPPLVLAIATGLGIAGSVATAVSQTVTQEDESEKNRITGRHAKLYSSTN